MHNEFNPYVYSQAPAPMQGQGQALSQGGYQAQGQAHQGNAYTAYPAGYPTGQYQATHYQAAQYQPQAAYPGVQYQTQTPFLNFSNDRFLKGLLIGAAAAYVLTNESVQRTAIKGVVKAWSMLQGGVEEIKERFQDAEAEIRAAEAGQGE